jgi:hypothetical protein
MRAAAVTYARCAGCGRSFDEDAWRDLLLVGTLASGAIANHVVTWPSGVSIEIRRCSCGASMARKGPRG